MTQAKARRRLFFLVNTAINRKAGIPDVACRKQESEYVHRLHRDCRAVRDAINRRVVIRSFDTDLIRLRYGHLIAGPNDF